MSMVHVENMAAAHLLAAQRLREEEGQRRQAVGGHAFNVADWSQNIVSLYSEAAGAAGPMVTLPYWLLFVLVRCAVALSSASCLAPCRLLDKTETSRVLPAVVLHALLCGFQLLQPKSGLHEAALTAGLPATMDTAKARSVLGFRPVVSKAQGVRHCTEWIEAGGGGDRTDAAALPPIVPLVAVRLEG